MGFAQPIRFLLLATSIILIESSQIVLLRKIVGGSVARKGEFPSIVSIRNGPSYQNHICGGTIINANWVVTAAHCAPFDKSDYVVAAGKHDISTKERSEQIRNVTKIEIHPGYFKPRNADIALLKLSAPFTFDENVQPANLPLPGFRVHQNAYVTAAGWGNLKYKGKSSDVLFKVTVPTVRLPICRRAYPGRVKAAMICAGNIGQDTCQGDSGGPLFFGAKFVGIVSFGNGCGMEGFPTVYTYVPFFVNWIQKITK